MKNPRSLFWLIIFLTLISLFVLIPSFSNLAIGPVKTQLSYNQQDALGQIGIKSPIDFRKGLDLSGGTSVTLKADMAGIAASKRDDALNSAKLVIEKRVNLFGVTEPVVETSKVGSDYRIIVELPGVTNFDQVRQLIGTTAQLSFWEAGATGSGQIVPVKDLPLGLTQVLGSNPKKTNLTGNDLSSTAVTFNQNTGKPQVQLVLTSTGTQKFADITKRNVGKIVAIVLDKQVIEAPRVDEPILGGDAVISGSFTVDGAKTLSTALNAGALPVPLSTLQSNVIGPTLGMTSLQKSLFAGILGFIVIVVFMIVLYGLLGVIASLALIIYTLLVLAIFKASSLSPYAITLTLSGIAGFVLSIGMAVDANILIFERMKEEMRQGKSRKSAIEIGFSRAWTSIRDSNISTLITSLVLYKFGTGTVQGFALVLAIGVLVSMFSAVVVTRTFLRFIYRD
jgi:preprotein translocase subunit SecD